MNLQVLVSTMNQKGHSLLEKMNIYSDAIIVNQCEKTEFEEFDYKGNCIRFLSLEEKGIGLSRNNALMRATSDICLLADDDVTYKSNYEDLVCNAFKDNPLADIIVFNVPSTNPKRPSQEIRRSGRVRRFNSLKYGAVRIAFKTTKIKEANIYFSLLFGGGAIYGSGEDSLFLYECIKKKLKVYACPTVIGYVSQEDSSWFSGYTDKYFIDKGVLFSHLFDKYSTLMCLQFAVRHREMFASKKNWREVFMLMKKGSKKT
jgi:glycosyltransferase involved in cell wall biosynthesis